MRMGLDVASVSQSIVARKAGQQVCEASPTLCLREAKKTTGSWVPSDLLPPSRLHLLKVSQHLPTAPPGGDQVFKHTSL